MRVLFPSGGGQARARRGARRGLLFQAGLIALAGASPTLALDPRDIVFECPCGAVWSAGPTSEKGELALSFGVRSLRATDSGDVVIGLGAEESSVGHVAAGTVLTGQSRTVDFRRPVQGAPIEIALYETIGEAADSSASFSRLREILTLWPVADASSDRIEFVDILTDTDGDGTGDVNEHLADTSDTSAASTPGDSTIDVLTLYNDGFREAFGGYPHTRIHHVMTLTNAMFVDSAANIRLRTVGMIEVALIAGGVPDPADRKRLMDRHGADLAFRFHRGGPMGCSSGAAGCASLVGALRRGLWRGDHVGRSVCAGQASATCTAHELGHNLGLAHSALQGEARGAFRWSRGHYVDRTRGFYFDRKQGTIMSYGSKVLGGMFSDPRAACGLSPCGVPIDKADGANAVLSLDIVRYQAAAYRAAKRDTDGDGIVDVADALPHDPAEHVDTDGDGIGDHADPDDDNDGVADEDDPFPIDPAEWADADDDGIGDNADTDVADLAPFHDAGLRAAVEEALGKAPGAPISAQEVATLTTLRATGRGIRDLTGLELADNLERLNLTFNEIADLSPLADLRRLRELSVPHNVVSDLKPLEGLTELRSLGMVGNPVSDLSAVAELRGLESFAVGQSGHIISDLSPVAELTMLRVLDADGIGMADLSFVQGLTGLAALTVPNNPISDLSPLSGMTKLEILRVSGTEVDDLSPLSGLSLRVLDVSDTGASLEDVAALPHSDDLTTVRLRGLGVGEISAVSNFSSVNLLDLSYNEVSDLALLRGLSSLRALILSYNKMSDIGELGGLSGLDLLSLTGNDVSDIAPLVRREVWDLSSSPRVILHGNPLDRMSVHEHIPTLESWGVRVRAPGIAAVAIRDSALRAVIAQALAVQTMHVDDPITEESMKKLLGLQAFGTGVVDLTGLEAATNLKFVWLGSNSISDLGPLAVLHGLAGLDLSDNRISDLAPLLDSPGIGSGDGITLSGNPLSEESLNMHIPNLLDRDVQVRLDSVRLVARIDHGTVAFDTSGYFRAVLGNVASFAARSADANIAAVEIVDGVLRVTPGDRGTATVTVEAATADSTSATLVFLVAFRQGPQPVGIAVPAPEVGSEGASEQITLARWFVTDDEQPLTFTAYLQRSGVGARDRRWRSPHYDVGSGWPGRSGDRDGYGDRRVRSVRDIGLRGDRKGPGTRILARLAAGVA